MEEKRRRSVWSVVSALLLVGFAIAAVVWNDQSSIASEDDYTAKYVVTGQLSNTVKRLEVQVSALTRANGVLAGQVGALTSRVNAIDPLSVRVAGNSQPKRNQVLKVINFQGRTSYTMSFNILVRIMKPVWLNIFHLGNANNIRNPGIWQFPGRRGLHIQQAGKNGGHVRLNWGCDPSEANTPPLNRFYRVLIVAKNGVYSVYYNSALKCRASFSVYPPPGAQKFYYSDPWYEAAPVTVQNLVFQIS